MKRKYCRICKKPIKSEEYDYCAEHQNILKLQRIKIVNKYELKDGQLTPKDGAEWLSMIALHKFAGKNFPIIPAEQWYYFYIMGKLEAKDESEKRFREFLNKFDYHNSAFILEKYDEAFK